MRALTPEQRERLGIAMTKTLHHGQHRHGNRSDITRCKVCARELACWVMTGEAIDEIPDGASELLAALPVLNDAQWRDDDHRTSVIRPYLPLLLTLDPTEDHPKAYALADYAVRVCAAEALDTAGLPYWAAKLRELAPITEVTADAAYTAVHSIRRSTWEVVSHSDIICSIHADIICALQAVDAAADGSVANAAAFAAGSAYDAASYANDACAETIERHTRAILDIICGLNAMEE